MVYSHICSVLNSRPLVSGNSEKELVINSNQLVKPYLSNSDQETILIKLLQDIFSDEEHSAIISKIFDNNNVMAKEASHVLRKEFLNSNVKLFTNKEQGLKPQLGDLVLVLKDEPCLGLIVKISSPHRVVVKHKHRGTNQEIEYHSRILSLIYRPLVPSFFLSLANSTSMPSKHLSLQF